jgi:hypothetical protein
LQWLPRNVEHLVPREIIFTYDNLVIPFVWWWITWVWINSIVVLSRRTIGIKVQKSPGRHLIRKLCLVCDRWILHDALWRLIPLIHLLLFAKYGQFLFYLVFDVLSAGTQVVKIRMIRLSLRESFERLFESFLWMLLGRREIRLYWNTTVSLLFLIQGLLVYSFLHFLQLLSQQWDLWNEFLVLLLADGIEVTVVVYQFLM